METTPPRAASAADLSFDANGHLAANYLLLPSGCEPPTRSLYDDARQLPMQFRVATVRLADGR